MVNMLKTLKMDLFLMLDVEGLDLKNVLAQNAGLD